MSADLHSKSGKNQKQYTHVEIAFLVNGSVKRATLPLNQETKGVVNYPERQYQTSQEDPLFEVNKIFDESVVLQLVPY